MSLAIALAVVMKYSKLFELLPYHLKIFW